MGNTIRRTKCLVFLTVGFLLQSWAQDPLLAWNFEDLLTDRRPSGVNPEFQIDKQGNFHLFYWDRNRDKLVYGLRSSDDGLWEFEWVDSTSANGFKSAMTLGEGGSVHVAFLYNDKGKAWLNYGIHSEAGWELETVPINSDMGKYGFDEEFPIYAQASLDIVLLESGEPLISYFDGSSEPSVRGWCGSSASLMANYYHEYELEMEVAYREGGSWQVIDTLNVPYTGAGGCLVANGDRFGEFNQIVEMSNGEHAIITNSLHNDDLLAFRGGETLDNWGYQRIDSVQRFASTGANGGERAKEGFDHINTVKSSDSVLHMVYGVSDLYGFSAPTNFIRSAPIGRRTFFYVRLHPDSLFSESYSPMYREMSTRSNPSSPNSHDGNYRSLFSLSTQGDDTLFIGHYNHSTNEVVFQYSYDGGVGWELDTLGSWRSNSPLKTDIYADSLHLIFYDSFGDQLIWASRHLVQTGWNIRPIIEAKRYGEVMASSAYSMNGRDEIFTAFKESVTDQLFAGTYSRDSWEFAPVDEPGQGISRVWVSSLSDQESWLAYYVEDSSYLKIAMPIAGNWSCSIVDDSIRISELQGALLGDSIHLVYFDLESQTLKWAKSPQAPSLNWKISELDTASLEPTGISISLHPLGDKLSLIYRDVFNPLLKYALYNPTDASWRIDTLSTPDDYFAGETDLTSDEDGNLIAVFRDELANSLILAEYQPDSSWEFEEVPTSNNNFIGRPVELYVDSSNHTWVAYGAVSNQNNLQLVRKDPSGFWEEITVQNSQGLIAQNFDIHGLGKSLYIIGQKTHPTNQGMGVIWAEQELATPISEYISSQTSFLIWPNPVEDVLHFSAESTLSKEAHIDILDMEGRQVLHHSLSTALPARNWANSIGVESLPKGMYVCVLHLDDRRLIRKFIR